MSKGLFFIPETNEETKELINTIVQRNTSHSEVSKMDFMYTIALLEEFYNRELAGLQDEITHLKK